MIIRFYDDTLILKNHVNLAELFKNETLVEAVEYCTFFDGNKTIYEINKNNASNKKGDQWAFDNEKEYLVFIDTKWENADELDDDLGIPKQIIEDLKKMKTEKIWVYTRFKMDEANELSEKLKKKLNNSKIGEVQKFYIAYPYTIINQIKSVIGEKK